MTDEEIEAMQAEAGPRIPKRRQPRAPRTVEAAPVVKPEAPKEKRLIPSEPEEFEKALRPYRPMASIATKLYSRLFGMFDLSELDEDEKKLVTQGIAAGLYEHIHEASGTMIAIVAIAGTAAPRLIELTQKKRKPKTIEEKVQQVTLTAMQGGASNPH